MARLPDILVEHAAILFVGINPGARSGKLGHHFAGPGNPFWKLLHAAGLTPIVIPAVDDHRLAEFGYGLTNLCARPSRSAAELTRAEMVRGAKQLRAKVAALEPKVVALVGLTLYPIVFAGDKKQLVPGPGPKPQRIAGARVFVVPNPSGLNASFPTFDAKLVWFRQLARFAGIGKPSATSK